jgi:hypothetical protein
VLAAPRRLVDPFSFAATGCVTAAFSAGFVDVAALPQCSQLNRRTSMTRLFSILGYTFDTRVRLHLPAEEAGHAEPIYSSLLSQF